MSFSIIEIKKNETPSSESLSSDVDANACRNQQFAAEIGIKICETSYQNKGLGTKLLMMLIEYLFTDVNLNKAAPISKIILDTNLKNKRAQHVYETIGFVKLRVNHNAWKDQLGVPQDSVDYEMTRQQYEDGIRFVTDVKLKEKIADYILNQLPAWFGLPDSTKNYIEQSQSMPFFAYYKDNQYVGFAALKETGPVTAEVYVMGILKEYHRKGIGRKLIDRLYSYAADKGYEFLQVKTFDAGHYEEYDRTRMFYEAVGFQKFEVFPTLWDQWNPRLVMVMSVKKNPLEKYMYHMETDNNHMQQSMEADHAVDSEVEIVEVPKFDLKSYWKLHMKYLEEDIFPVNTTDPASREEELEYFGSDDYRGLMVKYMDRRPDQAHFIYFIKDGVRIGCTHYITYKSEDGKCFVLDYWILPEYQGSGNGHQCFRMLKDYIMQDGAAYVEINVANDGAHAFWSKEGFVDDGVDEYDMPLMKLSL